MKTKNELISEIVAEYVARVDEAEDLDTLNAITEEAAERDDITHADYGKIYAAALAKAQSWQSPSKPAKSDSETELESYVDGIRDDIKKLYEAEPTDEEREEAEENGDPCDLYSYFSDALDVEYICDSHGEYIGAKIWVALGGPNVWIDTREGDIRGAWGCDRAESWLPSEICEAIDDIFCEYFACVRG